MQKMPPPMSLEDLLECVLRGQRIDYFFFWGSEAANPHEIGRECLSQWYPAEFSVGEHRFATAEHFMMWRKAILFGDSEIAAQILEAQHPHAAKKLGRAVRDFDPDIWAKDRSAIVIEGNLAKFSQNPKLSTFLLRTGQKVLVEASPRDTIWGIGLGEKNPKASDPAHWRGQNLLGFALMHVRAKLG